MIELILLIIAAALFDSISTMQQILIFIWLLSTQKPIRNALWFLIGLSSAYMLCGYYGYLALHQLNAFLHAYFPNTSAIPNSQYYPVQLIVGLLLFIGGIVYYFHQVRSKKPLKPHPFLERLKHINPGISFLLGAFISISGFPFSLPYLGILEKLTLLGYSHWKVISLIGLYNVAYALPMLLVLAIYLFLYYHVEDIEKVLHLHAVKWNIVINMLVLSGMGILMALDSVGYIWFSHPLFKSKFF